MISLCELMWRVFCFWAIVSSNLCRCFETRDSLGTTKVRNRFRYHRFPSKTLFVSSISKSFLANRRVLGSGRIIKSTNNDKNEFHVKSLSNNHYGIRIIAKDSRKSTSLVSFLKKLIGSVYNFCSNIINHVCNLFSFCGLFSSECSNNINDKDEPPLSTSLTLFVNRKSGGKDGKQLLQSLYGHLKADQICDLLHENPRQKLLQALKTRQIHVNDSLIDISSNSKLSLLPVICCGGDGTIRWIMDEAHAVNRSQDCCFGILPMGTGNDLYNHILQVYFHQQDSQTQRLKGSQLALQLSVGNQIHQTLRALRTFDLTRNYLNYNNTMCPPSPKVGITREEDDSPFTVPFDRWEISVKPYYTESSILRLKDKLTNSLFQSSDVVKRKFKSASRYIASKNQTLKGFNRFYKINNNISNSFISRQRFPYFRLLNRSSVADLIVSKKLAPLKSKEEKLAFNNYFGLGLDGDITCTFDNLRKQRPHWFFHRLMNKLWFGMVWVYKVVRGRAKNLSKDVELFVDGRKIDISTLQLQGIILPNIASYAGGTKLWTFAGEGYPEYFSPNVQLQSGNQTNYVNDKNNNIINTWQPQSSEDGLLEVVGLTSWTHLAGVKGGFARVIPLAQGRHIRLVSRVRLPMQVDGEPLLRAPCILDISHRETVQLIVPQPLPT